MQNLIDIKSLVSHFKNGIDLFICSSSFEDRCSAIAETVKESGNAKYSLIFYNDNEYEEIINNAEKLRIALGNRATKVKLNTNEPVQNSFNMNQALNTILDLDLIETVLLDTTTFTHESLLIIFKLLFFKKDRFKELYTVYVGATDYSTNETDTTKKWLSYGISTIRSVIGYPGVISPARENHLIVLFGFESDRTKSLIEALQFNNISLGFGAEGKSIDMKLQEINYNRHCDMVNYYQNAHNFTLSLIDPFETKNDILKQMKKFPNQNTVIAPMNNKISTIGSALVAFENPKVQLIYAKPVKYNVTGYSEPRKDCYLHKII